MIYNPFKICFGNFGKNKRGNLINENVHLRMIKKKVLARIKSIPFLIKQAAPYYKVQFRTNNILVKIYIYRIVKQLRLHLLGIDPFRKCVLYISAVIQRHLLTKKHAYILETCLKGMAAVVQATYIYLCIGAHGSYHTGM